MIVARISPRLRQQGIAAVAVMILLIAAVIFALSQTLTITASNSIDNDQQMDSAAALFLAESGLERARGILAAAEPLTSTVCLGLADGAHSLGRGNFAVSNATSNPAACDNSGTTMCGGSPCPKCNSCSVQSTGTVGSASRTLTHSMSLTTLNGTAGTGTKVSMVLRNTYPHTAVALFNLATRRSGNETDAICNNIGTANGGVANCAIKWNVQSQNGGGNPSVGGMGVAVTIPANDSATILQTLSSSRSYAEVGALFPGSSAPSVVGAYWSDSNGGGSKTVGNSATGGTNDGAACAPGVVSASCLAATTPPSPIPNQGSAQASMSWCYGADTLVFGFSGRSSVLLDNPLTAVTFNTAGTPAQNIALTQLAHFPNTSITTAPGDVYSDVWYVHNPNYLSFNAGAGATSYPKEVLGSIGATFTASIPNNSHTMTVAVGGVSSGKLSVGDVISGSNKLPAGTTILAAPAGGLNGSYTLSQNATGNVNAAALVAASTQLIVTAITSGPLTSGTAINGVGVTAGTTVSSGPDGSGNYVVSAAQTFSPTPITQGVSSAAIIVPSGGTAPSAGTIVTVYSGTGQFQAQTTVLATPAPTATTFTVDKLPTTGLRGAVICGGTCAFFDHGNNFQNSTIFSIAINSNTSQWSSGFMCLSGADVTPIPVTSSSVNKVYWTEVVQ